MVKPNLVTKAKKRKTYKDARFHISWLLTKYLVAHKMCTEVITLFRATRSDRWFSEYLDLLLRTLLTSDHWVPGKWPSILLLTLPQLACCVGPWHLLNFCELELLWFAFSKRWDIKYSPDVTVCLKSQNLMLSIFLYCTICISGSFFLDCPVLSKLWSEVKQIPCSFIGLLAPLDYSSSFSIIIHFF